MPNLSPDQARSALAGLGSLVRGRVILPNDADYDDARRMFYGSNDRRPAAMVRVAGADDVARLVGLARNTGLPLAVRGGGHSLAGHGVVDDGLVIDLRDMRALAIDIEQRTAWAEGGLTAGEYTRRAGQHGLATGFGDTGTVGIGGLTLGGGIGFLVRKYGLTIDSLLAAEVVSADGEQRCVDEAHEPDLFWALRGGGGNFGVVTRFKFRLHPVDGIVGGMLMLPATPDTLSGILAASEAAPEALSAIVNVMLAPPMPFVPAEFHGRPIIMALIAYAGEAAAAQQALAPFRALATPLADMLRPMPYPEIYSLFGDEGPGPAQDVARTLFLDRVDRPAAELILDHLQASTAAMAVAQLRVLGGAMARVPAAATAFAHRDRRIMVALAALFEDPAQAGEHSAWATGFVRALSQAGGGGGAYVNFLSDEGPARVREAYPAATWARLAAIKARYDPTNLFRSNHNIPPDDAP